MSSTLIRGIDKIDYDKKMDKVNIKFMLVHMPEALEEEAKVIDGKDYEPDCFGFEYSFNIGSNSYKVVQKDNKQAYYVDVDGNTHYMDYTIPNTVLRSAKEKCRRVLKKKGIIKDQTSKAKTIPPKNNVTYIEQNAHLRAVTGQLVLF